MKRLANCIFLICLCLVLVACGSNEQLLPATTSNLPTFTEAQEITQPETENSGKSVADSAVRGHILIAYFSQVDIVPDGADAVSHATPASGNTESAALEIQKQVGGDLIGIKTVKVYPVSHQECSAIAEEEMRSDTRPELSTHIANMDDYDTIYIGYPIWWHQEPMAIRSFLEEYDFSGKTVVPFCTSLAAGIEQSEENIKKMIPDATVLPGHRIQTGRGSLTEEITDWLSELNGRITESNMEETDVKIKITVGDTELTATLENNATTRALIDQMPMTLPMMDLYGREMCYRYGAYALPTDHLRSDGYEIGDIAYWAPGGSLVILYAQNGENFERQHLGHIDSGVELFETTGDANVSFELVKG